jgi:hypothetical protein
MGHGTQCKLNRSNNEAQTTPDVTEINYNPLNNAIQLYIFSPPPSRRKMVVAFYISMPS